MVRRGIHYLSFVAFMALLAAPAGYAQQEPAPADADESPMSVEEILTRDPDSEDYGEAPRCISTRQIRQVDVLDEKHIAFQISRDEYYLVQFERRCAGLRRGDPIIFEPGAGGRLCVLDSIRSTYDTGLGGITPGMRCGIDGFQSVTKEQLVLLKDTLKAERRKKRDS